MNDSDFLPHAGKESTNLPPYRVPPGEVQDQFYQYGYDYGYYFNYGDPNCSECTYNSTMYREEDVVFWQTPHLVVLVLLFLFIVFGNSCVLLAIGLSENGKKTRMNYFIMNLAIADLTVGLVFVSGEIAEKSVVFWHGGLVLCKVVRYLQSFVLYASTFMIVSLSIDRVDAIARPMKFTRKVVTVRTLVYTSWIISGLFSIPALILFRVIPEQGNSLCRIIFPENWYWKPYITLIALAIFIIPALVIVVCYTIIIGVIWQKGRGFSNAFRSSYRTPSGHVRSNDRGSSGIIPQAKVRTLKMTLGIVCVFVISWSPYFIYNLMFVYAKTDQSEKSRRITALIQSLAPLNSAANPIIYGVFSTRICKNLRRIRLVAFICDCLCRCRLSSKNSARGPMPSHTEQTYMDGTSGKSILRRYGNANRHFTEHETSNLIPVGHNGLHTGNRGVHDATKGKCIDSYEVNLDTFETNSKRNKGLYNRRPSGLPLVNRRMTLQETILLETYRTSKSPTGNKNKTRNSPLKNQSCLFANKSEPLEMPGDSSEEVLIQRSYSDNSVIPEERSNCLL